MADNQLNSVALEAALQAYRDYWTECGGAGFPIPAIGAAIEAYHAALPDEDGLVKRMRHDAKALRTPSRFDPVVPDNPELARWLDQAADALEAARAAAPETSDDR